MLSHPLQSETLQELAANESKETKKPVATEGMMWLFRYACLTVCTDDSGLSFTATALRRSATNKSEELSTSFNDSYSVTLKKYHSFVVKPVFAVLHWVVVDLACDESMSL
jgi:Glycolipid transfer protein (GLTP)